jgi:hypothetical protein
MNGKLAIIVGIFASAFLLLGTQAFAAQMGSGSGGDAWALVRPDVPEEYTSSQQAPCLVYCSAEDTVRVYSYYGEGHFMSFPKISIPKPTMKAASPSERSDIPEMNRGGEVPTWY